MPRANPWQLGLPIFGLCHSWQCPDTYNGAGGITLTVGGNENPAIGPRQGLEWPIFSGERLNFVAVAADRNDLRDANSRRDLAGQHRGSMRLIVVAPAQARQQS